MAMSSQYCSPLELAKIISGTNSTYVAGTFRSYMLGLLSAYSLVICYIAN